ncbi:MAG: hypothetical protein JOZ08_26370 [Verrucomicrobia bacterium]|nr:hypothetical protein [Verrucomicrobiota bacterium]MBV8277207.1 hypothetical protein [Verrucomicrobiota bacterium]
MNGEQTASELPEGVIRQIEKIVREIINPPPEPAAEGGTEPITEGHIDAKPICTNDLHSARNGSKISGIEESAKHGCTPDLTSAGARAAACLVPLKRFTRHWRDQALAAPA